MKPAEIDVVEATPTKWTVEHPDLGTFTIDREGPELFAVWNQCGLRLAKFRSKLSAENAIRAVIPHALAYKAAQRRADDAYRAADRAFIDTAVWA